MTNSNSIVSLSVVDEIHDLNNALATYHLLVESWVQGVFNGEIAGDPAQFTAGLQFLRKSITDGYKGVGDQIHQIYLDQHSGV